MRAYIDSSVLLRTLLDEPDAFREWDHIVEGYASELLVVEAHRVLDRLRLQGDLDDGELADVKAKLFAFVDGLTLIGLDRPVLRRAGSPFSTVIGALDAIHLATALLLREESRDDLVLLTHDRQLRVAAEAEGLEVRG